MRKLSRYQNYNVGATSGPSDLQWLEDGFKYIFDWAKDTHPSKRKAVLDPDARKSQVITNESRKPTKRKKRRGRRKIIRIREIEIITED